MPSFYAMLSKHASFGRSIKDEHLCYWGCQGGAFKSKSPFRYASVDRRGFIQEGRSRFNISSACPMIQYHKWRCKFGSQLDNPEMRWALNVWIAFPPIRDRCNPGGKSCCVAPSYLINSFIRSDNSLLLMVRCG